MDKGEEIQAEIDRLNERLHTLPDQQHEERLSIRRLLLAKLIEQNDYQINRLKK